jgi:hypothetical protein
MSQARLCFWRGKKKSDTHRKQYDGNEKTKLKNKKNEIFETCIFIIEY